MKTPIALLTFVLLFIAGSGFAQLEVTLELPVSEHVLGDPFPARVEIRNTGVRTLYVSREYLEFHSLIERLGRGAFHWEQRRGSAWVSLRDECLYEQPSLQPPPATPGEISTEEVIAFNPGERMVRHYLTTTLCVPSLQPGDYRVRARAVLLSYPSQNVITKARSLVARWSKDMALVNGLSEPRSVRVRAGPGGDPCGTHELLFNTSADRGAERFSQCLKSAATDRERGRVDYWLGVKHEMAGELPAAEDAYRQARMSQRGGGVAAALTYQREDPAVTVRPALPPVRMTVHADVSRAPAGVPIALEVRFTNTTAERMFVMKDTVEPSLQQFVQSAEGAGVVEVERVGNGGEMMWHHCPVTTPPPLTEADFMEIDGRKHMVSSVFPIEPGETRIVRLDNIGVCYDLFVAGTYRIAVSTPTLFSKSQVVERHSYYYVTSETQSEVYRKRERKTVDTGLISVVAHRATQSFRDARDAVTHYETKKAMQILKTIRAQAPSDEIRAAALFWEGIAHENQYRFATAREVYAQVARSFPRTASGRIAGHRTEALRGKQDSQ